MNFICTEYDWTMEVNFQMHYIFPLYYYVQCGSLQIIQVDMKDKWRNLQLAKGPILPKRKTKELVTSKPEHRRRVKRWSIAEKAALIKAVQK